MTATFHAGISNCGGSMAHTGCSCASRSGLKQESSLDLDLGVPSHGEQRPAWSSPTTQRLGDTIEALGAKFRDLDPELANIGSDVREALVDVRDAIDEPDGWSYEADACRDGAFGAVNDVIAALDAYKSESSFDNEMALADSMEKMPRSIALLGVYSSAEDVDVQDALARTLQGLQGPGGREGLVSAMEHIAERHSNPAVREQTVDDLPWFR